jgi:hypothetical protein
MIMPPKPVFFTRACALTAMAVPPSLVAIFVTAIAVKPDFDSIWSPSLVAIFVTAIAVKPDFDSIWSYISLLALGSMSWLGTLFFAVAAAGMVLFAFALRPLEPDRAIRAARWLLYAGALCLVLLMFIDIDHPDGVLTLERAAHWSIVGALAAAFATSAILIVRRLKPLPAFHGIYNFSLALVAAAGLLAGAVLLEYPEGLGGLLERIFLAAGFLWAEVVCLFLLKLPEGKEEVGV